MDLRELRERMMAEGSSQEKAGFYCRKIALYRHPARSESEVAGSTYLITSARSESEGCEDRQIPKYISKATHFKSINTKER